MSVQNLRFLTAFPEPAGSTSYSLQKIWPKLNPQIQSRGDGFTSRCRPLTPCCAELLAILVHDRGGWFYMPTAPRSPQKYIGRQKLAIRFVGHKWKFGELL
jgi:hypothetical protein